MRTQEHMTRLDPAPSPAGVLSRLADFREMVIIGIILAACVIMGIVSPPFRTLDNLWTILLAVATQAIVAVGMTALLVSGGFDLSVGSTVGLTGAVVAMCMLQLLRIGGSFASSASLFEAWTVISVFLAILAGLVLGTLIGTINGLIIAKVRINAFIATLAMMWIVRGALEVITGGRNIYGLPKSFTQIGQGKLWVIQFPIIISIVLVVIGDLLLRKSRFFRQNYYIGGNEKAAILSGIRVNRMKIFNYALTGFLAAVAGVIMTARFGSASTTTGKDLELQVISAVIIGGASLQGGEGTVLGSFLGCILMAIIITSLNLLGVDIYWQRLIIGVTLLLAVMIDTVGKMRKGIL